MTHRWKGENLPFLKKISKESYFDGRANFWPTQAKKSKKLNFGEGGDFKFPRFFGSL
jgi:hypothetical protein